MKASLFSRLAILSGILCLSIARGEDVPRTQPDPLPLMDEADRAAASGEYDRARELYLEALRRDRKNMNIRIRFLQMQAPHIDGMEDRYQDYVDGLQGALSVDHENQQILSMIVRLAWQQMIDGQVPKRKAAFETGFTRAEQLLRLEPERVDARQLAAGMLILAAEESPTPDTTLLNQAKEHCWQLLEVEPRDSLAQATLARTYLLKAVALDRSQQPRKAALARMDTQEFVDLLVEKQPDNAGAHLARFQCLEYLAQNETDKIRKTRLTDQAIQSLLISNLLMPRNDPLLQTARLRLADAYVASGLSEKAEAVYRLFVKDQPSSRGPRLKLVEYLAGQPGRRKDAIRVLDMPFNAPMGGHATDFFNDHDCRVAESIRWCTLCIEEWEASPADATSVPSLDAIDNRLKTLEAEEPRNRAVPVLRERFNKLRKQ